MPVALNDDDARRSLVRHWFALYLLRGLKDQKELDFHTNNIKALGVSGALAFILDSKEGQDASKARRKAAGLPAL